MDAQATSTYFRGFTEHMPVLCDSLSISPFDAGETILQEGEEGTWLGVLLKGSCARSNKQRLQRYASRLQPYASRLQPYVSTGCTLRLPGELDVIVNGNPVHRIKPGEIIGEMIVWFGGVRQATLKASTSGVIATLLMG